MVAGVGYAMVAYKPRDIQPRDEPKKESYLSDDRGNILTGRSLKRTGAHPLETKRV